MKTWKQNSMAVIAIIALAFAITACKDEPDNIHTHDAGKWVTTLEPKCTTVGTKEQRCTICGVILNTDTIAALGHDWNTTAEIIIANATETENSIRAIMCKRDKSHTKNEEVIEYATGTAGLEYTLITTGDYANTYGVSKGSFNEAVVHIPAYHREPTDVDYIPVTTISRFAINPATPNTTLTTVTLAAENQLKTIGNNAFLFCPNLTSITIPASVTEIGNGAFNRCTSLTSITIPASVTEIGNSAFNRCTSLTNITVDANNPNYASEGGILYNKDKTTLIGYPSANGNIILPVNVKIVGDYAFYDCTSLINITIPEGLTNIGNYTFYNCTNLMSLIIPSSVTNMGDYAFYNWTVTQIIHVNGFDFANEAYIAWGSYWITNCAATIVYGNCLQDSGHSYSWTTINPATSNTNGNETGTCTKCGKTNERIAYATGNLADDYFQLSGNVYNIVRGSEPLPNDVYIPSFYNGIPVSSISGFSGDINITSVIIGDGITSISGSAFVNCTNLTSLTIPSGLKSIGINAFGNCINLNNVTIPASLIDIVVGAFYNCQSLTNIIIDENNPNYVGENGMIFNKNKTVLVAYPSARGSITIPSYVTVIYTYAFDSSTILTGITIHEGVTEIGLGAFYNCRNLTSIIIPSSVTTIGSSAFSGWTSSQTINIQGHANQTSADSAWGTNWRSNCNANIIYQEG